MQEDKRLLLEAALNSLHKMAVRFCRIMKHDDAADPFQYEEDGFSNSTFSVQADEQGRGRKLQIVYRALDGRVMHIGQDSSGQVSCEEEISPDDVCEMLYRCSTSLSLSI